MDANTQLGFRSKVFAALAYLVLFLGWLGLLVDIIAYFLMKDKYVKFHSGQALLTGLTLTIVGLVLAVIFFGEFVDSPFAIPMDITYSVINILYAFYALMAIIYIGCAIGAFTGKEFRIPVIAKLLGK